MRTKKQKPQPLSTRSKRIPTSKGYMYIRYNRDFMEIEVAGKIVEIDLDDRYVGRMCQTFFSIANDLYGILEQRECLS